MAMTATPARSRKSCGLAGGRAGALPALAARRTGTERVALRDLAIPLGGPGKRQPDRLAATGGRADACLARRRPVLYRRSSVASSAGEKTTAGQQARSCAGSDRELR